MPPDDEFGKQSYAPALVDITINSRNIHVEVGISKKRAKMVQAWYMNYDTSVDQREPHQCDPPRPVSLDELAELGVEYFKIKSETDMGNDPELVQLRKDRGYSYEDHIVISKDKLPNYDEKIKMFFTEHLHDDDEIRLCTDGSGYFDVRNKDDKWIRIQLTKGDMIVLPAGIYHRFTLDSSNYIEARRYFIGDPVWTPVNRPNDSHPARQKYLASIACA